MSEIEVQIPKLHPGQQRVLAEAQRMSVLEVGRRWGKSFLGIHVACQTAIEQGRPAAWFAPTYKLLAEAWREVRRIYHPLITAVSEQEKRLEFFGGGSLDFWSIEKPDAGRGRKYAVVVIDEAGIARNLQDAWEGAIRPTLTDFKGSAWFLGTPKGRNFFHQLFTRGQNGEPGWKSWRLGSVDNPYIDPAEVEEARASLPQHVFEQEYLGIPADDGGNPFGLQAIAACLGPMSTAEPVVYGVDLAKSVDWTVAIGLDADGAVCRFERFQAPWQETLRRTADLIGDLPAMVDSTGVGDPVVEQLQRTHQLPLVEGFKFSSQSKQQLMEGLAVAIQTQAIRYPDGPIRNELESFEYEYRPTGVSYSAPAGLHDDCVMALALAVHRLRRPTGVLLGWA